MVITDFLDTADFMTNINPQGWVQTVIQRWQIQMERIEYLEVKSLYSYVNWSNIYPIGHPVIIQDNFQDLHKCKVLASLKLYEPCFTSQVER